eukprot:TRINITY_DN48601_c0_g1_i1.p1 TRINITY_DN48601_c0_g1~~TRINITY_DN48601_c0_g1_i1.p1  ORF type:complete len:1028 (+),score=144.35 TRINITY_DN48601_c0_g1_i1:49-3132(+)
MSALLCLHGYEARSYSILKRFGVARRVVAESTVSYHTAMRVFVVAHVGWAFDVSPETNVGRLKELVTAKLVALGVGGVGGDAAPDVRFAFAGSVLDDDALSLVAAGFVTGSKVLLISRCLAVWCSQQTKVNSLCAAFDEAGDDGAAAGVETRGGRTEIMSRAKPFPLSCDVKELGELGACWPLFFLFIRFLAMQCVAIFVLQFPVLVSLVLAPASNLDLWAAAEKSSMVSHWLLSAGNLGPARSTGTLHVASLIVCSLWLLAAGVYHGRVQRNVVTQIDTDQVQPSDFGIFIEGLPCDATDEREIKEFVEENARKDNRTEVVKVVVGFNVEVFNELKAELQGKKAELVEASDSTKPLLTSQCQDLMRKLGTIDALVDSVPGSSCCVAVLRNQREHGECLAEWDSACERIRRFICFRSSKPLFRGEFTLRMSRAGEPSDLLWENMHVDRKTRLQASVRTFLFMCGVFAATSTLVWVSRYMGSKGSFLATLSLIVSNIAITIYSRRFVVMEKRVTRTRQDSSLMVKMAIGMSLNYVLVPIACNLDSGRDWYRSEGLADQMWSLLLLTPFVSALLQLVDIGYFIKVYMVFPLLGRSLVPEKQSPDTTQVQYNTFFVPSELGIAKVFAVSLKILITTVVFVPMLPLAALLSAVGLSAYYFAVKHKLLRNSKRPYKADYHIARVALRFVSVCACLQPMMGYFFLEPSLSEDAAEEAWGSMVAVTTVIAVVFLVLTFSDKCLLCLGLRAYQSHDRSDDIDYFDVQLGWLKQDKYHTSHPVYRQIESIMLQQKRLSGRPLEWDVVSGDFPHPSVTSPSSASKDVPNPSAVSTSPAPPAIIAVTPVLAAAESESEDDGVDHEDSAAKLALQTAAKLACRRMSLSSKGPKLRAGIVAIITSVVDQEPPRWKGARCKLGSYDVSSGLWKVLVSFDMDARLTSDKLVPFDSMELSPGVQARVDGLQGAKFQKLNGKTCKLVKLDEKTGGWQVLVHDVEMEGLLPPERLRPPREVVSSPVALQMSSRSSARDVEAVSGG